MNENREFSPGVICDQQLRVLTKTLGMAYLWCALSFTLKGCYQVRSQGQVLFFCNVAVMTRYFELSRFKSMYFDHTWRAQCLVILYYYYLFIVFFLVLVSQFTMYIWPGFWLNHPHAQFSRKRSNLVPRARAQSPRYCPAVTRALKTRFNAGE